MVRVYAYEGATTVARYDYDGAKRRVVKKTYAGGVLDETRYSFFTEPSKWQVVEERVDSSADPERQFVWGLRYVDDTVERDRDTTGDGTLDERLYGMQDANWNVTAVSDTGGSVAERYSYDAYGTTTALTPAFALRGDSDFDWERRFAGYWYDSEVHFYMVRHRAYASHVGCWLQRDPIGRSGVLNLYEYSQSSPITFSDPSGLLTGVEELTVGSFILVLFLIVMWLYMLMATFAMQEMLIVRPRFNPDLWRLLRRCRPLDWHPPPPIDKNREPCKLIGQGGCNKKKRKKRCTYSCPSAQVEAPIECGPGNWDPHCPGSDGSIVELYV